jgi:hypothetical protein
MKNAIIIILAAVSITLGTMCFQQSRKTTEANAAIAKLKENVAEVEDQLQEQHTANSNLETRLRQTRATAVARSEQAAQLQQTLTNKETEAKAKAGSKNPMAPMAEMFKNPETKELIKTQQKAVLGPMIEKNYSAYFASLQLNPEQSATLKDLILKKTMVDAEMGISLMGDSDPAKREELLKSAKDQKAGLDDQIKQFLGDDNYSQFQGYEKTQPERTAINMFQDQQATGPNALNPDQVDQLIQIMSQDRQNFKFTTDYSDQSKLSGDLGSNFTEEKISQFQTEMEQLYNEYASQAQSILSPGQFEAFQKFLKSQRDMQAAGLKMAGAMFGNQKK